MGSACLAAPITNTVFFMGLLMLFFGSDPFLQQYGSTTWAILVALGISNAIPEALIWFVGGTAICIALKKALKL